MKATWNIVIQGKDFHGSNTLRKIEAHRTPDRTLTERLIWLYTERLNKDPLQYTERLRSINEWLL